MILKRKSVIQVTIYIYQVLQNKIQGVQWLSGRVTDLRLLVRASPDAICFVLEHDNLSCA